MEQTYEWIRLAQAGDAAAKDNLLGKFRFNLERSGTLSRTRRAGRPLSDWCNRTAEMYRKI